MSDTTVLHETPGCRVEKDPDGTVVKSGRRVHFGEAEALRLAGRLGLPAPRLHEARNPNDTEASIRMDFVAGEPLDTKWPDMSDAQKCGIARQLREILTTMRRAQRPPADGGEGGGGGGGGSLIGSCDGGAVRECRVRFTYTGGPFADEAGFNDYLIKDVYKAAPTQIRNALARRLRTDHRIVFTHGDLVQHNILVRDDGRISGLIDWEYAGWYPEYWEYVKFFQRHADHRDWKDYAADIFPQLYDDELVDYQALVHWQHT